LAIDIVAVLGAVAIAGGPGDGLDDTRPLGARQVVQLVLQATKPVRRNVVLAPRRQPARRFGQLLLRLVRLFDEGFAHAPPSLSLDQLQLYSIPRVVEDLAFEKPTTQVMQQLSTIMRTADGRG